MNKSYVAIVREFLHLDKGLLAIYINGHEYINKTVINII